MEMVGRYDFMGARNRRDAHGIEKTTGGGDAMKIRIMPVAIIAGIVVLILGWDRTYSYITTGKRVLEKQVDEAVPFFVEIERAQGMVDNLDAAGADRLWERVKGRSGGNPILAERQLLKAGGRSPPRIFPFSASTSLPLSKKSKNI
jgi:hypothetical protein